MTATIEELHLAELPETMRIAQMAIKTEEVQDIIRQLARYHLGVCMPHMHLAGGQFSELPAETISLEVESAFVRAADADPVNTLPVAWRWQTDSVVTAGSCHILLKRCGK